MIVAVSRVSFCLNTLLIKNFQLKLFWLLVVAKFDVIVLGFLPMCISNGENLVPGGGFILSVLISCATSDGNL